MAVAPVPLAEHRPASPDLGESTAGWRTITEEAACQGYKTGHMRWVLAIGFSLAGIALAAVAILS